MVAAYFGIAFPPPTSRLMPDQSREAEEKEKSCHVRYRGQNDARGERRIDAQQAQGVGNKDSCHSRRDHIQEHRDADNHAENQASLPKEAYDADDDADRNAISRAEQEFLQQRLPAISW